jgi:hypothetical protein
MLLLVAAALPALLGNQPVPADCITLSGPRVNFRPNVARATSSPWVDSNAWRFARDPQGTFCIDAPGKLSALAAAEAFTYGATAFIKTGTDGTGGFGHMVGFLHSLPADASPTLANIGFVDDRSTQAGEMMNLLARRNLLYRVVKGPDPKLPVSVTKIESGDPSKQAYAIRQQLGDDKRLLRLYGTEVVIGHLTGDATHVLVHLVNYSQRAVTGMRVRVLGSFSKSAAYIYGFAGAKLVDFNSDAEATEFTIADMNEYAVIDLSR